ncbi:MAG: tetratricopeptide repeat protein [Candidatus Omnitrophica bacterium]|nr:tetratricopeptide repeat protein [Candidatus Omnitrophota bacterium]
MNNRLPPIFLSTAIAILSVFCCVECVFAQETKESPSFEKLTSVKQEQAKKYREAGLECQRIGNAAEALGLYQKAVAIYPDFAVAYNDLGVVFEALGRLDQAEESYLKSVKIDPLYASAYTNLALLYEGKRDLEKAAFYWNKRVEVGQEDDPWTQKAASRLRDIRSSLSGRPFSDEREQEILDLMQDVAQDKGEVNKNSTTLAQSHFKKAKLSFNRGDMATAIKEALDAQYLDQDNPEIEAFIEKAELRALTR